METMEPPESTSGAPVVEPADAGNGADAAAPPDDEPDEPDEAVEIGGGDPEILADIDDTPEEPSGEIEVAPPVVAVLVTSGTGEWLEPALESLAGQDYPALSVLVLDNAAPTDPTARIAAELPSAYVRRLPEDRGFAAAANEALESVEGATFLLFCHDDVVLDSDAVRSLVEEAYRSNAGIIGPKLVDYERPEVLLEVGMTVDHYGVPFSTIEPGEIDQEQHDGVRDVFFVSHAVMLVRADLFRVLGGFDPDTAPGSDDVDLCWRARLAGARVLVAPASRVRHRRATAMEHRRTRRQTPSEARAATRARVRLLYKAYASLALWWVLPSGFLLTVGEAIGLVFTRRARQAGAVIAGWFPSRRGWAELRRGRKATQKLREVDDGEVRDLMIRGSARFRGLLVQRLHARDRLAYASSRARVRVEQTREQMRRTPAILLGIVAMLLALGSRVLFLQKVPDIGGFQPWPGVGALWSTFTSTWRYTMVGARVPATPVFALMSLLSTVLLGHGGLARTVVVVGALPLATWGAYRVVRSLTSAALPAAVAATAYAANPAGRDAIGRGDLGPLVLFALAPFVLHALLGAEGRGRRGALHVVVVVGLFGAIATAVWPPAIVFPLVVALAFALSTLFAWGDWSPLRVAALALLGAGLSVVLVSPWIWSMLGADPATQARRIRAPLSLGDALRFDSGPARSGWYTLGLVVIAFVPLVIATGPRLVWATRMWLLTLLSFLLVWAPTRLSVTAAVPAPEGVLVPAALGLAVAAGLGVSALLDDMRRSHFGWRQVAAVAAVVGLTLPMVALAADTISGRWQLPSTDWPTAVAWMRNRPTPGGFRVLWLGNPAVLPVDAKIADGFGYGLTLDGAGDARALWAAPEHEADRMLARALATARAGDTSRLGHLLAPIGVRYVAFVGRVAPGHGQKIPADEALGDALARQLDLSVSRIDDGAIVYANDAWIPRRAVVPADTVVEAAPGKGLEKAARSDAGSVAQGVGGSLHHSDEAPPGTLLWAEAADAGWRAQAGGKQLTRSTAFDWTNAFASPERASVGISYRGSLGTRLLLLLEAALWIGAVVVWQRTRPVRSRKRGSPA